MKQSMRLNEAQTRRIIHRLVQEIAATQRWVKTKQRPDPRMREFAQEMEKLHAHSGVVVDLETGLDNVTGLSREVVHMTCPIEDADVEIMIWAQDNAYRAEADVEVGGAVRSTVLLQLPERTPQQAFMKLIILMTNSNNTAMLDAVDIFDAPAQI